MFIFAIAHYYTFSHKPYVDPNSPPPPCCSSFVSMWDVTDVRDDLVLQVQSVESTVRGAVDVVRNKRGQNATKGKGNSTEATPLLTRQTSADLSSDEAPVIPWKLHVSNARSWQLKELNVSRLTMRLSGRVYTNLNEFEKGQQKKARFIDIFCFHF